MQIAIETRFDSLLQMTNDVLNTECCVSSRWQHKLDIYNCIVYSIYSNDNLTLLQVPDEEPLPPVSPWPAPASF